MRWAVVTAVALTLVATTTPVAASGAEPVPTVHLAAEQALLALVNAERSAAGLAPVAPAWDLLDDARRHSRMQASGGCGEGILVCHNPELEAVTTGWWALGENVGVGRDAAVLHQAFMRSPAHRANVLGDFNYAAVGVARNRAGALVATEVFMRAPDGRAALAPGAPVGAGDAYALGRGAELADPDGLLVNDPTPDVASVLDRPPRHGSVVLAGDGSFTYRHDGSATVADSFSYVVTDGLFDSAPVEVTLFVESSRPPGRLGDGMALFDPASGRWKLHHPTGSVAAFYYGVPGDVPLFGDWNCDGIETVGMYRPSNGFVYLRNSNGFGVADREFYYGGPGDVALVGDWNADGCDTLAVLRRDRVFVSNRLGTFAADYDYRLEAGGAPVSGDFDGDGRTTVTVIGAAGMAAVVAGDFDGDGRDSLVDAATGLARFSSAVAEDVRRGFIPVAGLFLPAAARS